MSRTPDVWVPPSSGDEAPSTRRSGRGRLEPSGELAEAALHSSEISLERASEDSTDDRTPVTRHAEFLRSLPPPLPNDQS